MSIPPRLTLGAFLALSCTVLAACGGGGGGSSTLPSTGGGGQVSATPTPSPPPVQTASTTSGLAYVPGGVLANDAYAMTAVQYEDTNGNLLATPVVNEYGGTPIAQIAMGTDGTTAAALTETSLLPDSMQAVSIANASFSRTSSTYDLRSTISQPYSVAVMPDNSTMIATGGTSIAEVMGLKGSNPTTSAAAYPVQINPGMDALAVSPDGKTLITRGQSATLIYSIAAASNQPYTYQFTNTASDSALDGSVAGRGDMAFDPADSSKAVFGWMATGDQLTLETGLPTAPAEASTIHLHGSTLYSIAFTPDGKYAVVGSHDGIYVVSGAASGSLAQVAQNGANGVYSTAFTGGTGAAEQLAAVYSVGVSSDGKYVAALAAYTDAGFNDSFALHEALLAIPIDSAGTLGSATTVVRDLKTRGAILGSDGTLFR